MNDICNNNPENSWFLEAQDKLDEEFLGLGRPNKFLENADWEQYKYFRIINKEKYLWVKLKYGI